MQAHGGVAATDDGRYTKFASNDGGMREGCANVGDDGGGARKQGCPADVGRGCHQDLARLELIALLDGGNYARSPFNESFGTREAPDRFIADGMLTPFVEQIAAAVRIGGPAEGIKVSPDQSRIGW